MHRRYIWAVWLLVYGALFIPVCLSLVSALSPRLSAASQSTSPLAPLLLSPVTTDMSSTGAASSVHPTGTPRSGEASFAVLIFSKTAGFRHDSILAGVVALRELGEQHYFAVDATEDATYFTDEGLAAYRVVVFLNTTGDILNADQQAAFERFIQRGGGFVGIHAASDTEYDWPWYGQLVGASFASHLAIQPAMLRVADQTHLSTRFLPGDWGRTDEWYNFRHLPEPEVHVLLHLDETTYEGGTMGTPHPISWYHTYAGGRAWYTGMGHTSASYSEPLFREHLAGGILWSAAGTACD